VEEVLSGGLATLPLAPLSEGSPESLPDVIRQIEGRIDREASPGEAGVLWTAVFILMRVRYNKEVIHSVLRGVKNMKESVTYQEILEEGEAIGFQKGDVVGLLKGKAEEARRLLLRQGSKRFGVPDSKNGNRPLEDRNAGNAGAISGTSAGSRKLAGVVGRSLNDQQNRSDESTTIRYQ
jgi:hypothetical protein